MQNGSTQEMPQPATSGMSPEAAQALAQIKAIVAAPNLAGDLDDTVRGELGNHVLSMFEMDHSSMGDWQARMERAIDLASITSKDQRVYPWEGAANIRYPLITSAALQYNARAYPAIVPSTDIVKVAVSGADKDNQKENRAGRVSKFMSWQCKVDMKEWERQTDQLLLQLPIVGDVFRKVWWNPAETRPQTQLRLPGKHVVVNNNAESISAAPRTSDQVSLYPHQVESNIRSGRFVEFDYSTTGSDDQEPLEFIEQCTRYDLDGDDYPEPYIVTVHKDTKTVVRVVAAYDLSTTQIDLEDGGKIIAADPDGYLVHYQFWPSIDGGFLGMGIGILLGDISETINSTLNLIMDGAHLSSLGAGFIGAQNFRVKGGAQRLRPGEYKHVNFTGQDIRAGLVPLTFPEPSGTLFQVLGMMIDAGREMASINDVMTGDMGRQNMPVGTTYALIEQGMMVFSASYKRIYRALQDEFAMLAKLNGKNLSAEKYQRMLDEQGDPKADFNLEDMDILPVSDPKAVTSMQRMGQAQFLLELAQTGLIDKAEAIRRILEAGSFDEIDALMPKPDPKAAAMQAAQEELMVLEIKMKEAELDEMAAKTMKDLASAQKDAVEADLAPMRARIDEFKAMKERLSAKRGAIEAGSAGGMAQSPGDGIPAGGAGGGFGNEPATFAGSGMESGGYPSG